MTTLGLGEHKWISAAYTKESKFKTVILKNFKDIKLVSNILGFYIS